MKKSIVIWLLSLLLVACVGVNKKMASGADDFLPGQPVGELNVKKLEEASGLVASIKNPGYYWVHNDSGNKAEVFLIDETAKIVLTCSLNGVHNRDWEDIAVGPGPINENSYLYIGDIGDNNAVNRFKFIYRFEEPTFIKNDSIMGITEIDKITFQLADDKKDSEALLIDPNTKDLYVVSKRESPVHLYQLKYPYSTTDTLIATSILTLPLTQITAGDISRDGKEILLKNYQNIFYWKIEEGRNLEETLKEEPKILNYKPEPQGEAIAWAYNGSGFYTVSEMGFSKKTFLYFYKRK